MFAGSLENLSTVSMKDVLQPCPRAADLRNYHQCLPHGRSGGGGCSDGVVVIVVVMVLVAVVVVVIIVLG